MKILYYVIRDKYSKLKDPKISYIFEKTLVLSIIFRKSKNEDENMFKEELIQILRILGLIENI